MYSALRSIYYFKHLMKPGILLANMGKGQRSSAGSSFINVYFVHDMKSGVVDSEMTLGVSEIIKPIVT